MAKANFPDARKNYESALTLFAEAGDQTNIGAARLSLAKLSLEEGKASDVESLAHQAIQGFQENKLPDSEADARNTLARLLILQGKLAAAQAELTNAARLGVQDRVIRISLAITGARLKARDGRLAEARQDFDALLKESKEKNLVALQLDIRLALAEIDALSEPKRKRASLAELQQDARNSGYLLVATKAERLQASRSQ
jgi:hypothetical protein